MFDHSKNDYPLSALTHLNELIGEVYSLYDSIPGLDAYGREQLDEALSDVRAVVAHGIARGLAKPQELGKALP
jgi:hypothetical protein